MTKGTNKHISLVRFTLQVFAPNFFKNDKEWYLVLINFFEKKKLIIFTKKQGPTRHRPMAHQILNNSFFVMRNLLDSHETVMRQS